MCILLTSRKAMMGSEKNFPPCSLGRMELDPNRGTSTLSS